MIRPIQAPNISCTESHVPFPLLRSYQRISPGPMHMYMFRNKLVFWGEDLLAPRSHIQAIRIPPVSCPRLLIKYIRSYPPFWRPFLNLKHEEAPCRGDSVSLFMVSVVTLAFFLNGTFISKMCLVWHVIVINAVSLIFLEYFAQQKQVNLKSQCISHAHLQFK